MISVEEEEEVKPEVKPKIGSLCLFMNGKSISEFQMAEMRVVEVVLQARLKYFLCHPCRSNPSRLRLSWCSLGAASPLLPPRRCLRSSSQVAWWKRLASGKPPR